ncbi:MAG: hypothetical protein PHT18_00800 [Proteiniphilum sp.]|nr:hypothetical protein [Proteiniphilum sp.]
MKKEEETNKLVIRIMVFQVKQQQVTLYLPKKIHIVKILNFHENDMADDHNTQVVEKSLKLVV